MTTLQKTLATATIAVLAGAGIYEVRQAARLGRANQSLQQLQQQQELLNEQVAQLQRERDTAKKQVAELRSELASADKIPSEVLRLRGQVGVLRDENAALGSKSALSKITADPETRKMIREQQKMGMSAIYDELATNLKLTPELKGQFSDLLADHVMDNIDLITQVLHDKSSVTEIDQVFDGLDSALHEKLATLIGPEGLAQYRAFSQNLLGTLSAAQFEGNLTGDKEAVAGKKNMFLQAVQMESKAALAAAGLSADHQVVPILNLRNIASEETAARNLKLLDDIYERVNASATGYLNAEELEKFREFRAKAQENSQAMLLMNRKLMAPISQ